MKSKTPHASLAKDLYTSPLFLGRRAFVERTCERWFILSAEHGLVDPLTRLDPYDKTLTNAPIAERRGWSTEVLAALERQLGTLAGLTFEIHAGQSYCDFGLVDGLTRAGATVVRPTLGLKLGAQLALYSRSHGRGD